MSDSDVQHGARRQPRDAVQGQDRPAFALIRDGSKPTLDRHRSLTLTAAPGSAYPSTLWHRCQSWFVKRATPPLYDAARSLRVRVVGVEAAVGGLLWIVYGVFEFLQPWGIDTVYDDNRGYDVVVDRTLFTVYTGAGAVALTLTSLALLGALHIFGTARRRSLRTARTVAALALAAALISSMGAVLGFDPLATGMRVAGSLLLGAATLAAAWAVGGSGQRYRALLGFLGAVGLFLLPLWPLVYAVEIMSATAGAATIAVFGLAWMGFGSHLFVHAAHHGKSGRAG